MGFGLGGFIAGGCLLIARSEYMDFVRKEGDEDMHTDTNSNVDRCKSHVKYRCKDKWPYKYRYSHTLSYTSVSRHTLSYTSVST